MKVVVFLGALVTIALALPPKLDPDIFKSFETKGMTNVIVSFKNSKVSKLRRAVTKEGAVERSVLAWRLYETLQDHADQTQAKALAALTNFKTQTPFQIKQLWITNQLIVRNVSADVLQHLASLEDISAIQEEKYFVLDTGSDLAHHHHHAAALLKEVQWGVANVDAPAVWMSGNRGQGTVVANIDTGVRHTHEALRDNFRAEFGWYDPWHHQLTPSDDHGHGTHAMGSAVGRRGIGVAPHAKWIACKGFDKTVTSDATLLDCGQWIACPTDPIGKIRNCSLAPHVVSNSWTAFSAPAQVLFTEILKHWKALNIVTAFSIGNSGSNCSTTKFPGNSPLVIGVGALDVRNATISLSSRGPTLDGRFKPDIAAPGGDIYSASNANDTAYRTDTGTSFAAPHVAGVAALLHTAVPGVTVDLVRRALTAGAQPTFPSGWECGGAETYPNNHVGHGKVNAPASIKSLKKLLVQG